MIAQVPILHPQWGLRQALIFMLPGVNDHYLRNANVSVF